MRQIKSQNTSPELRVRRVVRELGHTGYRLHRKDLPGKPDMAWIGRKLAIFIHGCFWHGHTCRRGARVPKTRVEYWTAKIERNRARDAKHEAELLAAGWRCITLWECELKDGDIIAKRLQDFFSGLQSKQALVYKPTEESEIKPAKLKSSRYSI